MTEKEKFVAYLTKQGFKTPGEIQIGSLDFGVPHHRVSDAGIHTLITAIKIDNYDGVDTAEGNLGCVVYYYLGTKKRKHCRNAESQAEILKKVECPRTAAAAIKIYEQWRAETQKLIDSWRVVL